ncbi:hypothetical protein GH714_017262 [Hevea brasiliensis]|uniref:GRAM domain-containing protein n=1 Tax=Hevea brasiliensis TaxID=3981 RepID=A0A6A6K549_HEVBR|nr:hypothetical protein GH714_017262 [Hevea brasiliensis]
MEQQSKADTDSTGQEDPKPKSVPNTNTGDNHLRHAPNGDANEGSVATGSDYETLVQSGGDQLQAPSLTGSVRKSVHWSPELVSESHASRNNNSNDHVYFDGSNPYVSSSPAQSSSSFSFKDTMGTVRDVLGIWGRKMGEASRKVEDLAGNTWQHLKTAPSFADAALGRIAQGTKVVIPLHQLKAVNPSSSRSNSAEKYIQIISVDNHEFWFMGFLNYDGAVRYLQDALQSHNLQSV